MDGKPEDPIEVGARTLVDTEAAKLAIPDIVRMAIHADLDKVLDRVDHPSNLDIVCIHVEHLEGFKDFDIDHNLERTVPPYYRVEVRGRTKYKHLKENVDE